MIVADAAPIIAFARLGRLALLQHIVEELVVPEAVYDDLVVKGRGKPGAARHIRRRHAKMRPERRRVHDRDGATRRLGCNRA